MSRDYRLYLGDILTAAERIQRYLEAVSFEAFAQDSMRLDAVLRNLEVIGEAAKSLPAEV